MNKSTEVRAGAAAKAAYGLVRAADETMRAADAARALAAATEADLHLESDFGVRLVNLGTAAATAKAVADAAASAARAAAAAATLAARAAAVSEVDAAIAAAEPIREGIVLVQFDGQNSDEFFESWREAFMSEASYRWLITQEFGTRVFRIDLSEFFTKSRCCANIF
jgi:hypothetical protein